MEDQILDGIKYPILTSMSEQQIRVLARRSDEFTPEMAHIQQTSVRHFDEGKIVCVPQGPFYMVMTVEQKKVWDTLD